jgi:hypothetical protein
LISRQAVFDFNQLKYWSTKFSVFMKIALLKKIFFKKVSFET